MPVTLTLTDLAATPTGAAAAIAGTDPAAANTVYVSKVDGSAAWAEAGTRTGDGAVTLSVAPGVWWAYLLSQPAGAPVATAPQVVGVTDGQAAVATRIRDAIEARIRLLNLPAVGTGNGRVPAIADVVQQLAPDSSNVTYPFVLLTSYELTEAKRPDTNLTDDLGHPVRVLIVERAGTMQHGKQAGLDLFRQRIERAFDGQHLPGVDEVTYCAVEPQPVTGLATFNELSPNFVVVSGLVIRCHTRQVRGLNV